MPEGDTIYRAAAALRTALVGRTITGFAAPRLVGPSPSDGAAIETVESHGKHLEIVFDDGIVLHTHMRMTGSWHLYRPGEKWRRRRHQARVVIETAEWVAVAFNAPVAAAPTCATPGPTSTSAQRACSTTTGRRRRSQKHCWTSA